MAARILGCANLITETSQQREVLRLSLERADQLLGQWQADPLRWQRLLLQVFRRTEAVDLSGITIEILEGRSMAGLYGAYAPVGADGEERIYLSDDWLTQADSESIKAVLLEEIGHAIDHRLHGENGSSGDEGAIFSALIRGVEPRVIETTQNDHQTLIINGLSIAVEGAAPVASGSPELAEITEDTINPEGDTVRNIFETSFSDTDGDTLQGIALTANAASSSQGVWEYSTNGGRKWKRIEYRVIRFISSIYIKQFKATF